MSRLLMLAVLLAPTAHAADTEPYKIKLVVAFQKHRLLTPVFREQVSREIRDGLQAALGKLARVSLADDHPLLADIRERGFGRALAGHAGVDGFHTHFVLVSFSGADYEIEAGMHDGLTGLPGQVTRTGRTRDRAFVARIASLLVERDVSPHGTVAGEPDAGGQVKIDLKGPPAEAGKWVKKDDVFVAVRMGGGAGRPLPFTLLQATADPVEGTITCRVWSRYEPGSLGRWSGIKAVRLGTRSGPVRLRLMQETPEGLVPMTETMAVQVRPLNFEGAPQVARAMKGAELDTSRVPKGEFGPIAFVTVRAGGKFRARYPVPVLDGRIVTLPVPPASASADAQQAFDELLAEAMSACQVQAVMFEDINKLAANPEKRAEAMLRVKQTLKRCQDDHVRLVKKRQEVREHLAKLPEARLALLDARLRQVKAGEKELNKTVTDLEAIERDENDPANKEWLVKQKQAEALERQAELGEALKIYEGAPEKFQTDKLKKHVEALRARWEPKGEDHARARKFCYETWPALETGQMKAELAEAARALAECRKAKDPYGPIKFRNASLKHADRLLTEAKKLFPGVNAGDDVAADLIKEISAAMQKLVLQAEEIIETSK